MYISAKIILRKTEELFLIQWHVYLEVNAVVRLSLSLSRSLSR
jgi:hypothetical protein